MARFFFILTNNINLNFFSSSCLVDRYQLNLSDPATPIMFGIHNLHNHILFFLCLILVAVLFLLFSILFSFSFYSDKFYSFSFYSYGLIVFVYSALSYLFMSILHAFLRFGTVLKFSKSTSLFSIRSRFFNSLSLFSTRLLSFFIVLTYAISFGLIDLIKISNAIQVLLITISFHIRSFFNLFAIFLGLSPIFSSQNLIIHENFYPFVANFSLSAYIRYCLVKMGSFAFFFVNNLLLFFELCSISYFFNLITRQINVSSVNLINGIGLDYKFILDLPTLRSFCKWFFSSNWKSTAFFSVYSNSIANLNFLDSNLRHEWLTYLLLNRQYRVTHNLNLEIIWTVIPTIILIFIAVPSFALLYSMDELLDPSITVKVIGHQWYWSYEYADFRPLCNQTIKFDSYMVPDTDLQFGDLRLLKTDCPLILPKETNIRFLITSTDVLHSWAMPSFGIKMDAVPGRLNQTSAYIMESGRYYGQCSELCGVNHAFMPIEICVVEPHDYYNWLFLKLTSNG